MAERALGGVQATTCQHCHAPVPHDAAFCPACGTGAGGISGGGGAGPALAGYTVLGMIGQGGTATVYLARQDSLDRQVAVKVIRREVDDPKVWRDFQREARTIARLSGHPNVVTVYTAGRTAQGQPFLATEYMDRGSLGDVVTREGALAPDVVSRVGVAVADALAAAHGLGILHRDVKPGNVLLDSHDHVKLADFGIAKLVAGQSVTTTGTVAFTPEHVAPEILRGDPEGTWSDVYGLASTLVAAATGVSPFVRNPDERMEALLSRKIMAPPPTLPSSVPTWLARPLTRALDPDPAVRPTLVDLRRQLAGAGDGHTVALPIVALPTSEATGAMPSSLPPPSPPQPPAQPSSSSGTGASAAPLLGGRPLHDRRRIVPVVVGALVLAVLVAAVALANRGGGDDQSGTIGAPTTAVATTAATTAVAATVAAPATTAASTPPVTIAPVTNAPAPTVAPTTIPSITSTTPTTAALAPPTAAAPATMSPPAAATSTSAAPVAPPPSGEVTQGEADTFIRTYYDEVAAGDYETSWSKLTPEFQQGKARSYDYYTDFWDSNDLEVREVELLEATETGAVVRVTMTWDGGGQVRDDLTLVRDGDRQLLIAAQDSAPQGNGNGGGNDEGDGGGDDDGGDD